MHAYENTDPGFTTVQSLYARLGYTPNPYPHRHAIDDEEQGYLDALPGAVRARS